MGGGRDAPATATYCQSCSSLIYLLHEGCHARLGATSIAGAAKRGDLSRRAAVVRLASTRRVISEPWIQRLDRLILPIRLTDMRAARRHCRARGSGPTT